MSRYISRSKRFAAFAAAALCCSFDGAGCAPAPLSPAACEGYAVMPVDDASKADVRWAVYLSDHLRRRAEGGERTVRDGDEASGELFALSVGMDSLLAGDFRVERSRRGVRLTARDERSMLWLQYQLMKSLGDADARIETADLPPATVGLRDTCGRFAFSFRGLYTPRAQDVDLAGIIAVDNVEEWGLWGHQTDRVLLAGGNPPERIFATVDGVRSDSQFCFSAEETFRRLERYVVDNFGEGEIRTERFVIAPADDSSVCTCAGCSAVGNTAKSATPAVTGLVTRLAERFPLHRFYMLGYGSTREAPAIRLPANAGAILSAMELPLTTSPAGAAAQKRFCSRLARWKEAAERVYVWDYIQNFDDYLSPFPVLELTARRLRLYREQGVDGVFFNGSGYDYAPFDDMRTYVLSALLLDPSQSAEGLMRRYFAENYPRSGDLLSAYCAQTERRAAAAKTPLNIYGGIRDAEATWLDAGEFVAFYEALEALLPEARGTERKRLHELLASLSYTRLEVARNHAGDPYGFAEAKHGKLRTKPRVRQWMAALSEYEAFPRMRYVSESQLPVGEYLAAWRSRILEAPETPSLLLGAELRFVTKPDRRYDDSRVLTDGVRGLAAGYHYGWHIGSADMEVEIPVEQASRARRFEMSFLDLPRHRIRAPRSVEIYKDGVLYRSFAPSPSPSASSSGGRIFTASGAVDFSGAERISVKVLRSGTGRGQFAADELFLIP